MLNQQAEGFINKRYLSLESYKRSGDAVRTPVWFAEEKGTFYLYTLANAGKVKRIRNNSRVRIASCTFNGRVTGAWINATARILGEQEAEKGQKLLIAKYGVLKRVGDFFSRLRKRKQAVIAINIDLEAANAG